MNPVVKAQLEQFKNINPVEGFTESEYFEVHSIFSIMNGYLNDNIDPFEMHLKGNEFGIDGCGITVQGELIADDDGAEAAMINNKDSEVSFTFLQSKRSEGFDYGDISKFFDAVYGFFKGDMLGESDQLDALIYAKDKIYQSALKKNPNLVCFFVSTGKYNPIERIEKLIEANRARFNDLNLFDKVLIELFDAKMIQEAYRAATSSNSQDIEFTKCQTMPDHPHVEQAYIGYIKADQILKLATNRSDVDEFSLINQTVFFDNIRDFNPRSKINEGIIGEIRNGDKLGFVFRNNGVTVVAKKINRTGDRFRIDDYQIVNGC